MTSWNKVTIGIFFYEMTNEWAEQWGPRPVDDCIQFIYDSLYQMKRTASSYGVFSVPYGAKGLEFKHVFILDGAWSSLPKELESETSVLRLHDPGNGNTYDPAI